MFTSLVSTGHSLSKTTSKETHIMSWISKNLTLDLIAIAIGGMQSAFDRIKSEPEPGTEWPQAEEVPAQAPAAVEPAPVEQPAPQPEPAPQPAAQESAPEPAAAPATEVNHHAEAQSHLRDINLNLGSAGIEWITGTLFPSFGVQNLNDVPADKLPDVIQAAVAYKLEKGLN